MSQQYCENDDVIIENKWSNNQYILKNIVIIECTQN